MHRFALILVLTLASSPEAGHSQKVSLSGTVQATEADHCAWVATSLSEIQTIKVGMTRGDLLKLCTTEGGLSTALRRTYVYRECRLIKVDVEFMPVDRPERDSEGRATSIESEQDLIKKISRPYLASVVAD